MNSKTYRIIFTLVMCITSLVIAFWGIKVGGFTLKQGLGIFLMIYANNLATWENIKKHFNSV